MSVESYTEEMNLEIVKKENLLRENQIMNEMMNEELENKNKEIERLEEKCANLEEKMEEF